MEAKIYEIIKSWAGVSTWYTSHPLDQKRFYQAMSKLVFELGSRIDIEDFEKALRKHANSNPAILGQPSNWDEIINSFVLKAEIILSYEYEKST